MKSSLNSAPLLLAGLLGLTACPAQACKDPILMFQYGKQVDAICYLKRYNAMMSQRCEKKPCQAIQLLKKGRAVKLSKEEREASYTPGTINCARAEGSVVILKDDTESEASFCVADDGSRVDVFSISLP